MTNIDLENIANDISKSSKKINNLLRNIDSQKRPILLSALMICVYQKNSVLDFANSYKHLQPQTIIANIPDTLKQVLTDEGVDNNSINILLGEVTFITTDQDLVHTDLLKRILMELEENVIPLFKTKTAYDIIGKFYEEFLRYAGIANVKKGIVLTSSHITNLFTELIELKTNDIIFDPCCGTGAFLIAGMNQLIKTIQHSKLPDKKEKIANIKTSQLLGIEKSTTMFALAISNMLFRGDGKSQIFNEDFFSSKAIKLIEDKKPTIGFINPPFGGKDNQTNPTKKEIQFLERLLGNCSRYVIIIAPLSTYFKDADVRERILAKHTLKYVVNMPSELFQPTAMTHTAIAVFKTNTPHLERNKVIFYDLKDDGFVLSKNKGRTDQKNKWNKIKLDLLSKIASPTQYEDGINLVYKNIKKHDEWIIQAHNDTEYLQLTHKDFENTIKEYSIYQKKKLLDLIDVPMDEVKLFDFFKSANIGDEPIINIEYCLNTEKWMWICLSKLFEIKGSKSITDTDIRYHDAGDYPYITTSAKNNGVGGFYDYYTENGNILTVDSATIGICFYQETKFSASNHVEKLIPKFRMNKYIALFVQTLINKEQFRYGYGRNFSQTRLKKSKIKLPVDSENKPDWEFIENYIKSLPYSGNLLYKSQLSDQK